MPTIESANMNGNVKRSEMAKMVGQFVEYYANNISRDYSKNCNFKDGKIWGDLQDRMVTICQMGIMGQDGNGGTLSYFRPYDTVTRAEFWTLLSRVLRWDRYDGANPYYEDHLIKLKQEGVIVSIYNPQHIEKRGDIMEMLQKASKISKPETTVSETSVTNPFDILLEDNSSSNTSESSKTSNVSNTTTTEEDDEDDPTERKANITKNSKIFDSIAFPNTSDSNPNIEATLYLFSQMHLLSQKEINDLKTLLTTSAKYLDEVEISTKMIKEIFGEYYDSIQAWSPCYPGYKCWHANIQFLAYQYHNWIFGKENTVWEHEEEGTRPEDSHRFFLLNEKLWIIATWTSDMGIRFTVQHTINNEKVTVDLHDQMFISQNAIDWDKFNVPQSMTFFGEKYYLNDNSNSGIWWVFEETYGAYDSYQEAERDITQHIKKTQKLQESYLVSFSQYPGVFFEYENTNLFSDDVYNNYVWIYYSTESVKTDNYKNVTDLALTQKLTCYFGIQKTDAHCTSNEVIPLYNYVNYWDKKYGIVQAPHYELPYECYNQDKTIDSCKYQLTQRNLPLYKLIPAIEDHYYILQPANGVVWEETTEGLWKPVVYVYDPEQRENSLTVQLAEWAEFTHLEPYFSKGTTWNFISDENSNIKVGNQVYPYLYYSSTAPNYQNTWTWRFVAWEDVDFFLNTKLDAMHFNEKEKSDFLEYRVPHFKETSVYFIRFKFNEELDPYAKLIFKEQPDQVYRMFMEVLEVEPNTPITFSKNNPHEHDTEYLKVFDRKWGFEALERWAWFTERK